MSLIDTNILVRHFTQDQQPLAARASAFIAQLEAEQREVTLTEAVVIETANVLGSRQLYAIPRETIRRHLSNLIQLPSVRLASKPLYLRALDIFVAYPALSFVDALLVAYAETEDSPSVVTFDLGFRQVAGVTQEQP